MCENQTMDETTKRFHDWIFSRLRKSGPKTQSGLAAALGIAHPQINQLKKGERDLKVREVPIIAAYLEAEPPSWGGQPLPIRDDEEILAFLRRIDGLSATDVDVAFSVIVNAKRAKAGGQEPTASHDRLPSATPHRESSSSRSQS